MASAAPPDGRLFEADRAWLERYDPTLISSRYSAEFSYESFEDDSDLWGADNEYAWSVGGELPLGSENFEFKLANGFTWHF